MEIGPDHDSLNESSVVYAWNVTTEDDTVYVSPTDSDVLKQPKNVISFCAMITNLSLLVLILVRLYQYITSRASNKSRWARLHFLGVICVVHLFKLSLSVFTAVPSATKLYAHSDWTCKAIATSNYAMPLTGWMYLLTIGIYTFFQVYHPNTLVGTVQFVFWLLVHPCLWVFSFVVVYVTNGSFFKVHVSNYYEESRTFCITNYPTRSYEWFGYMYTLIPLGFLAYLAFILSVGVCFVKPTPSSAGRENGTLQWIIDTRIKAVIFIAVLTVWACGTCLPVIFFSIYYFVLHEFDGSVAAMNRLAALQALQSSFYLVFSLCCLILHEVGVYSLVRKWTNGGGQRKLNEQCVSSD